MNALVVLLCVVLLGYVVIRSIDPTTRKRLRLLSLVLAILLVALGTTVYVAYSKG